jgi:hypothetical protein
MNDIKSEPLSAAPDGRPHELQPRWRQDFPIDWPQDQYIFRREFIKFLLHLTCPVIPRVEKGELHCPCHNGIFDLLNGRPLAGPPRRPLASIKLEVRDGKIFAAGIEERTV